MVRHQGVVVSLFISVRSQVSKLFNAGSLTPVSAGFTKQNLLLRLSEAGQGETSMPHLNSFSIYTCGINATP